MLITAALLFCSLSFLHTGSSVQYAQKLCRTEDDCDWDHCCVEAEVRLPGFNGICRTPTQKGEYCNPDPFDKTEDGRYRIACPCSEGLNCQPTQETVRDKVYNLHVCEP